MERETQHLLERLAQLIHQHTVYMKAFVLHGKEDLRSADLDQPAPRTEQVILKVRRTGICGSDMHYYLHGRVGKFVPNRPFVLGHEFAGEIVELGDGVARVRLPGLEHRPFLLIAPANWEQGEVSLKGLQTVELR